MPENRGCSELKNNFSMWKIVANLELEPRLAWNREKCSLKVWDNVLKKVSHEEAGE